MTTALPTLDLSSVRISSLENPDCLNDFTCGERDIDRAIPKCCSRHQAHQAKTYCALLDGAEKAAGFYTLSINAHDSGTLDPDISAGKLGSIPFIYVDYLAVSEPLRRQKLGTVLLGHALDRCASVARTVGCFGIALHALTPIARDLYYTYGFRAVDGANPKMPFMVLPVRSLFELTER